MTPLEGLIRDFIASEGPMRLDRYMGLCLGHPQHGYYMTRDPLGERGDFITAPEVSQMFGELIGVWAISAWAAMGQPNPFSFVELGPGRGTLMSDMLRTARKAAPGFAEAAEVHLVETSPVLAARQRATLAALGVHALWHEDLTMVPQGPAIIIANEFFDAIPIRQFEYRVGRWHERAIGLEDGELTIGLSPAALGGPVPQVAAGEGVVIEQAPARAAIAEHIGQRLERHAGAALIVDYGHLVSGPGDTLQAMKGHAHVPITAAPGECDLTSHVDFEALARSLRAGGAEIFPAFSQRDFLLAMGLAQRTAQLAASAGPEIRDVLGRQAARLADENQMGNLFKVLAAGSPGLAPLYPFGRT